MFIKFRGQSEFVWYGRLARIPASFAWTEFAPLRRTAIRSLTTRLNVPVVRSRFGQKSERSHKIDHHGLQTLQNFDLRIEMKKSKKLNGGAIPRC
jgi:hypothetical protein